MSSYRRVASRKSASNFFAASCDKSWPSRRTQPGKYQMQEQDKLIQAAKDARERAYAPYSNLQVGAAVEAENGDIYIGCNVESASYGLTVCAERVAIWKGISCGIKRFTQIAVVVD